MSTQTQPNETEAAAAAAAAAPPAEAKKAKAEAKPVAPPFTEDRWQLKEHRNQGHWICVSPATTPDDLMRPEFWANVARHLHRADTVEVHWDDASQFAELYVLDAGRNWASVDILRHKSLKRPLLKDQEQYDVGFNGPVDKFRITRRSDRQVIKAGFATEADALKYLSEHKRKMAA
jgi:hypothetical protein